MNASTLTAPSTPLSAPLTGAPAIRRERSVNATLNSHAGFARLRAAGAFFYELLKSAGESRAIRELRVTAPDRADQLARDREARRAGRGPV